MSGRDKVTGRWVRGNQRGFTKRNSRAMQRLAVESRLLNQKRRMHKALLRVSAVMEGADTLELLYLNLVEKALLEKDTNAMIEVLRILTRER